jgi:hypothetical protein
MGGQHTFSSFDKGGLRSSVLKCMKPVLSCWQALFVMAYQRKLSFMTFGLQG